MKFYRETPIDLFILTSESEGVPVSIMEALSFGIPAMATAVGGVPELISNHTGYLLTPNPTSEEIAEKLLDFLNLSHLQRTIKRQAARTAWETGWSAKVNFTKWAKFLEDI